MVCAGIVGDGGIIVNPGADIMCWCGIICWCGGQGTNMGWRGIDCAGIIPGYPGIMPCGVLGGIPWGGRCNGGGRWVRGSGAFGPCLRGGGCIDITAWGWSPPCGIILWAMNGSPPATTTNLNYSIAIVSYWSSYCQHTWYCMRCWYWLSCLERSHSSRRQAWRASWVWSFPPMYSKWWCNRWLTSSIWCIDHGLNNPSTCIDKPIVHLEDRQACLLRQLPLLLFRRVWMLQIQRSQWSKVEEKKCLHLHRPLNAGRAILSWCWWLTWGISLVS